MNEQLLTKQQAIYFALLTVPKGRVISYGTLARLAGLPNGARLVGRTLSQLPLTTELPWHRVVNTKGRLSFAEDSAHFALQKFRLESEGVCFVRNKINLRMYGYSNDSNHRDLGTSE